jgi:hypothetical protein
MAATCRSGGAGRVPGPGLVRTESADSPQDVRNVQRPPTTDGPKGAGQQLEPAFAIIRQPLGHSSGSTSVPQRGCLNERTLAAPEESALSSSSIYQRLPSDEGSFRPPMPLKPQGETNRLTFWSGTAHVAGGRRHARPRGRQSTTSQQDVRSRSMLANTGQRQVCCSNATFQVVQRRSRTLETFRFNV